MRLFTKTLGGGPIAAVIVGSYDGRSDDEREADYKAAREYYKNKMQEFRKQSANAHIETVEQSRSILEVP